MIVSPEDGMASPLDTQDREEKSSVAVGEVKQPFPDRSLLVKDLIWQALQGTLPVTRPLKSTEPLCFSSKHINMVFDSVQGPLTNAEIQEKYQVSAAHVSQILNHPFTEVLQAALLGQIADNLTDPLERMRAYSHEMIDRKIQIARDPSTPKQLVNKIANDFLDRVGYGPRAKPIESEDAQRPEFPVQTIDRFASALESSARVRSLSYDKFVQRGGAVGVESQDSPATDRQSEQGTVAEGLPGGSSVPVRQEKVA